jgi:hypothetical protein
MADSPAKRPGIVTAVVVLIYIAGIGEVLLGILTLFVRYLPEAAADGGAFVVSLLGAGMIILGLAVVSLASGTARGSRFARLTITLVLLAGLVLDAVSLALSPAQGPTQLIAQAVVCVLVILPLWVGPGRRYFATHPAAATAVG